MSMREEHTGPHPPDPITFSWAKVWVPLLAAGILVVVGGVKAFSLRFGAERVADRQVVTEQRGDGDGSCTCGFGAALKDGGRQ